MVYGTLLYGEGYYVSSNMPLLVTDPNGYITVEGDTFDGIALEFYNEEKLASTIISANPDYCDRLIFEAGIKLVIPVITSASLPESLPPWRRSE